MEKFNIVVFIHLFLLDDYFYFLTFFYGIKVVNEACISNSSHKYIIALVEYDYQ